MLVIFFHSEFSLCRKHIFYAKLYLFNTLHFWRKHLHNKIKITQKHKYFGHLHFQSILLKWPDFRQWKPGRKMVMLFFHHTHTHKMRNFYFAVFDCWNKFGIHINDFVMVPNGNGNFWLVMIMMCELDSCSKLEVRGTVSFFV